jgi:hypothetical protein
VWHRKADAPICARTIQRMGVVSQYRPVHCPKEHSYPPWVNIGSAGWVNIQSARTSFRKLSKMTEAMKGCAFAASAIAFKINDWIEERFSLPQGDLPDLSDLEPEVAAATLRRTWGLGNAPIPNHYCPVNVVWI